MQEKFVEFDQRFILRLEIHLIYAAKGSRNKHVRLSGEVFVTINIQVDHRKVLTKKMNKNKEKVYLKLSENLKQWE